MEIVMAMMIVGMLIGFGGFTNKMMGGHNNINKQETMEKHQEKDSANNVTAPQHKESDFNGKTSENTKQGDSNPKDATSDIKTHHH